MADYTVSKPTDQISEISGLQSALNAADAAAAQAQSSADAAGAAAQSAQETADTKAAEIHEHTLTQINGLMDGDKIAASLVPNSVVIWHTAYSDEQMNALSPVNDGDMCRRPDVGRVFYYVTGEPGQWHEWDHPDYPVTSVNGKTGDVNLVYSDVGAAAESHTHDTFSQITTGQTYRAEGEIIEHAFNLTTSDDPQAYALPAGYSVIIDFWPANSIGNTVVINADGGVQFTHVNESGVTQYVHPTVQVNISQGNGVVASAAVYNDSFQRISLGRAYIPTTSQTGYDLNAVVTGTISSVWSPYYEGGIVNDGTLTQNGPVTFGASVTFAEIMAAMIQATDVYPTTIYGHTQSGNITMGQFSNIVVGSTTGMKIGMATTQKLSFHNATPTAQRASAAQAAVPATPTVQQLATLVNELRAAMVEKGLIKGSA